MLLNDQQGAIADFTQALQFNNANIGTYYNRGCAHHQKGSRVAALDDFNQVLQRDPDDIRTYVSRGLLHQEMGKMEEAIADLRQAAKSLNQQGATTDSQQVLRVIEEIRSRTVVFG